MSKLRFMVKAAALFICPILLSGSISTVQAAETPALAVSNSSVPVNGILDVTVTNAQSPTNLKDWVGLYEDSVTPGSQPAIWWDYVLNQGVTDGNGTFTFDPANIPSAQKSRYTAGKKYKFILAYNDSYTVSASISFNATTSQNPAIISISPVNVNTSAGTAPSLPATVTAKYSNGTNGTVNVTWNPIDPVLYSHAGSLTVKGIAASTGAVPKASVTFKEGSGPVMSFQVISDTHIRNTSSTDIHNQHLTAALKDLNQISPNSSALIIDGDITDSGSSTQYDQLNSILQSVNHAKTYFVMGNHDIFNYTDYNTAKNLFLTKTGMSGNYYDYWLNGYHFIVLGSDAIAGDKAVLSTAQLNWFQQKLKENVSPNKPIFVFVHQPLSNTVSGSNAMQDQQQDQQLKSILTQFPQVVLFTGHTHSVFTESTEFYNQQYCNMANIPSTAYLWYDPTYTQPGSGSQGLCVDVYSNKVVIKGRDFTRQEWIGQGTFLYNSGPFITSNKSTYARGENITVTFSNGPGNAKDWIGIYKSTDTPGSQGSTAWLYVNDTQTATTGISNGSVTFTGGLGNAGTYKIGFFQNDGYTQLGSCVNITVQ